MTDQPESPPVAIARRIRRITQPALRRAMCLTGHCEMCGAGTFSVAFYDNGVCVEVCAACSSDANRCVDDHLHCRETRKTRVES